MAMTVLERAKLMAHLQGKGPLAKTNPAVRGERLRRGQREDAASFAFEDIRYPLSRPVIGMGNLSGMSRTTPQFDIVQDNVRLYYSVHSGGNRQMIVGNGPDCFWVNKGSEKMPGQYHVQMRKSLEMVRDELIRLDVEFKRQFASSKGQTPEESAAVFDRQVRCEFSNSPETSKLSIQSPLYNDPHWDRYRNSYMEDDTYTPKYYPDRDLEVVRYLHVDEQGKATARNGAFRMQVFGQLFWVQFSDLNGEKTEVFKKVERDGLMVLKMSQVEARMVLEAARKKFGKEVGAHALFERLGKAADRLEKTTDLIKTNIIDFDKIIKLKLFKNNAEDIFGDVSAGRRITHLSRSFASAAGGITQLPKKSDLYKGFTKTFAPQGQNSSGQTTGQTTGQTAGQSTGLQGQSHDNP